MQNKIWRLINILLRFHKVHKVIRVQMLIFFLACVVIVTKLFIVANSFMMLLLKMHNTLLIQQCCSKNCEIFFKESIINYIRSPVKSCGGEMMEQRGDNRDYSSLPNFTCNRLAPRLCHVTCWRFVCKYWSGRKLLIYQHFFAVGF